MRKYAPGDLVRINARCIYPHLIGRIVVVTSALVDEPIEPTSHCLEAPCHRLHLRHPIHRDAWAYAPPGILDPVGDSYDRCDWSECAWQPKVEAAETWEPKNPADRAALKAFRDEIFESLFPLAPRRPNDKAGES